MLIVLTATLSDKTRESVQGLELALNNITDPFNYLILEGD